MGWRPPFWLDWAGVVDDVFSVGAAPPGDICARAISTTPLHLLETTTRSQQLHISHSPPDPAERRVGPRVGRQLLHRDGRLIDGGLEVPEVGYVHEAQDGGGAVGVGVCRFIIVCSEGFGGGGLESCCELDEKRVCEGVMSAPGSHPLSPLHSPP